MSKYLQQNFIFLQMQPFKCDFEKRKYWQEMLFLERYCQLFLVWTPRHYRFTFHRNISIFSKGWFWKEEEEVFLAKSFGENWEVPVRGQISRIKRWAPGEPFPRTDAQMFSKTLSCITDAIIFTSSNIVCSHIYSH